MNHDTRQALIDAGVLRPGSRQDAEITLLRLPFDHVLRIDAVGRAVAARDQNSGRVCDGIAPVIGDDIIARWSQRRNRRAA